METEKLEVVTVKKGTRERFGGRASWVRLDDEVVWFGAEGWTEAAVEDSAPEIDAGERRTVDGALKVVVQNGRLFQRDHPDIPVVVDKGRYLMVAVPRELLSEVTSIDCAYSVQDAAPGSVIFETITPSRHAPVPWVQALVNQVTEAPVRGSVTQLTSYPTRHSTSSHFGSAITWARNELNSYGYVTSTQTISVAGSSSQNLIADKQGGAIGARRLVIVTAHLDSINTPGGASSSAPGADDNASGSAGLLAIARIMSGHTPVHDLRLILFGGEEQGLIGSNAYIAGLPNTERSRIDAVSNMDMIANKNTVSLTVLLEGAALSQSVINLLAEAAATYTGLTVQTSLNPYASDHVPFINNNIPAVLTIEGSDGANTDVHTAGDTADKLEYDLALEILRMNVAMVATQLGRKGVVMPDIDIPDIEPMVPPHWLVKLMPQYSGRYVYNGGASAREGAGNGHRIEEIENPAHELKEPILIDAPGVIKPGPSINILRQLRFTVHIDIDGTDPLNVVSGTVARGWFAIFGTSPPHFIGRVTSNTGGLFNRNLVVEDFSFTWPGTGTAVNRLDIALTGGFFTTPTAQMTFMSTSTGTSFGPYSVTQESRYFRDVVVEVDTEDSAVNPEPYNTHTHSDRPAGIPNENLTLENVFARSGIQITRSSGNTINTSDAGTDSRWTNQELHDAMENHWSAFSNIPQWKMWIFLAELATSDTLGGVLFDGDINEPGGVDRQGTAVFTLCPFFHTAAGAYCVDNPPAAAAAQRELFFDLIHETGHAFNLAHSFQKQAMFGPDTAAWPAPSWMPVTTNNQALSWMNYPDSASDALTPPAPGNNATWFYQNFRFRFDDGENLFLRHAPGSFVQMGGSAWFNNHGRVTGPSLDRRLELELRTRSPNVELGEPVFVELRLRNVSDETVRATRNLSPSDGFVELAVTGPDGERRPFIPFVHTRSIVRYEPLAPDERIYQAVNMTMGQFGFPFKKHGPYRIEASYTNRDGSTAAAILHIQVRPPSHYDDRRLVTTLFNARVGRAMAVGGTRVMEDVNERIDWVRRELGDKHPASYYLAATRALPYTQRVKTLSAESDRLEMMDADPEFAERELAPVVDNMEPAADAIGHIIFGRIVDRYADCAAEVNKKDKAKEVITRTRRMFEERNVIEPVLKKLDQKAEQM